MTDGFQLDIRQHLFCAEFFSVIAHSLYLPDEAKLLVVAEKYAADDRYKIAGYFSDGSLAACAGMDLSDPEKVVLQHLAVNPAHRGQGFGKKMILELMEQYQIKQLEAETDDDAVGFYRKCGFTISDLGEKYPGTKRYHCSLATSSKIQ